MREDLPVTSYTRHVPHWRQDGATYFVTFRLADSLPQCQLNELRLLRQEWERKHPPPRSKADWEDLSRTITQQEENWLDQGMGSCLLRNNEAAKEVVGAMRFFDGRRYELGCYVVMPNHVHVVVRPLSPSKWSLETILQSWKSFTAGSINKLFNLSGTLWQEESFDRIIRNEEHLWRAIQYVGNNPKKAALPPEAWRRWLCPNWQILGWDFDQEFPP